MFVVPVRKLKNNTSKFNLLGDLPGRMEIVFKARNTRNVRNPARLPTSIPMVAYPLVITTKSNQFQGFRRYVYLFNMNPLAMLFIIISAVYMAKKIYLEQRKKISNLSATQGAK